MKSIKTTLLLLLLSTAVSAETVYVTEKLKLDMRRGASNGHKITKMLTSGAPLTVLSKNKASGYSKVRTASGQVGFVLTRFTQKTPAARQLLEQNNQQLEKIKAENQQLTETLQALQSDKQSSSSSNTLLATERDQLSRELQELKQTAGSAIQIKQQRDQLQERVVNIERENQQLRRDNQALDDTSNQDWFLNGGIIAFFGIFFGLLIPRITWQKRRSSWDSF